MDALYQLSYRGLMYQVILPDFIDYPTSFMVRLTVSITSWTFLPSTEAAAAGMWPPPLSAVAITSTFFAPVIARNEALYKWVVSGSAETVKAQRRAAIC